MTPNKLSFLVIDSLFRKMESMSVDEIGQVDEQRDYAIYAAPQLHPASGRFLEIFRMKSKMT